MAAAYIERGRDLRIDFLRGLCVIGMIVDHIAGASWLYAITGGNRFYTSAAEGFVFVSGLVAGRAYTRFILRDGVGAGLGRLLNRAGQLYLLAVALTFVFVPVSEHLDLPWQLNWNMHDATDFVVSVLSLHRTYYLVDVLSLYVFLLLASTGAFVLLMRGQTLLVLAGSWLLWLVYQVFPEQVSMPWPIVGNNLFNFAAWQVLFFTGLVIGHRWERQAIPPVFQSAAWQTRGLRVTAALLAAAIALYAAQDWLLQFFFRGSADPDAARTALLTAAFGKSDLRVGRIIAFGVVFGVFFLATTRWWAQIRRWLGWLVLPLGKNALFAYSVHVFLALGVAVALEASGGMNETSARTNAAIQIAGVIGVWAVVQLRPLRAAFGLPSVRLAVPAVLGVATVIVLPLVEPDTGQALNAKAEAAQTSGGAGTAAEQVARAYGTAIPVNTEPAIAAVANAAPVAQVASAASAPSAAAGQLQGTLVEPQFYTAALNGIERYFIYLPPGYGAAGKRFPVLYMLHGGGGRQEWIGYDLVGAADRAIASGRMQPVIIVLPQGDQGYWVNHMDGGPRWGDYFSQDLVHHIDATYATIPDARHRAVGGMSMGGWGALYQAFSHPDEFGVVGAHAPALRDGNGSMPFLPRGSGFNQFDPMYLASNSPTITGVRVWLDADQQDPWLTRGAELHTRLDQRHISNEWHTYPGRHGGTYWHDHVQEYLDFYAHALATP